MRIATRREWNALEKERRVRQITGCQLNRENGLVRDRDVVDGKYARLIRHD